MEHFTNRRCYKAIHQLLRHDACSEAHLVYTKEIYEKGALSPLSEEVPGAPLSLERGSCTLVPNWQASAPACAPRHALVLCANLLLLHSTACGQLTTSAEAFVLVRNARPPAAATWPETSYHCMS